MVPHLYMCAVYYKVAKVVHGNRSDNQCNQTRGRLYHYTHTHTHTHTQARTLTHHSHTHTHTRTQASAVGGGGGAGGGGRRWRGSDRKRQRKRVDFAAGLDGQEKREEGGEGYHNENQSSNPRQQKRWWGRGVLHNLPLSTPLPPHPIPPAPLDKSIGYGVFHVLRYLLGARGTGWAADKDRSGSVGAGTYGVSSGWERRQKGSGGVLIRTRRCTWTLLVTREGGRRKD